MKELIIDSQLEKLDDVLDFLNAELEANGVSMKAQRQIAIVAEEIYVNIAHYAYNPEVGKAVIRIEVQENDIVIEFEDGGLHYNPLNHDDPDTKLSSDERDIGGLGILIVKKMTDDVAYRYENGKNILTIKKVK